MVQNKKTDTNMMVGRKNIKPHEQCHMWMEDFQSQIYFFWPYTIKFILF